MPLAIHKVAGRIGKHLVCDSMDEKDCVTFFQHIVRRHTPFSIDSVEQPFSTFTNFGKNAQCHIQRHGDLMYTCYIKVTLPGIAACDGSVTADCVQLGPGSRFPISASSSVTSDDAFFSSNIIGFDGMSETAQKEALKKERDAWRRKNYGSAAELGCCVDDEDGNPGDMCDELDGMWAHYVNDVGHALIEFAHFKVGGVKLDTITGLQMHVWEELAGKSGRRLQEMTGRRYTLGQLFCDSREKRDLYIPLPFFFTHHSSSALRTVAMYYHQVTLEVTFAALEKLIVVSNERVSVRDAETGSVISAQDLSASLESTVILLSEMEEAAMKERPHQSLIIQHQSLTTTLRGQSPRIPLTFTSAVTSMFVVVRQIRHIQSNDWTNFSGIDRRDPITSMDLKFNATSWLTGAKPAVFWRTLVPYQHFSNIPESFVYCITFALDPEGTKEASGFVNFSKLDNIELQMQLQPGLGDVEITVMARNWNVLSVESGHAKLHYS